MVLTYVALYISSEDETSSDEAVQNLICGVRNIQT